MEEQWVSGKRKWTERMLWPSAAIYRSTCWFKGVGVCEGIMPGKYATFSKAANTPVAVMIQFGGLFVFFYLHSRQTLGKD